MSNKDYKKPQPGSWSLKVMLLFYLAAHECHCNFPISMAYLSYSFRRHHQRPTPYISNLYQGYCHQVCRFVVAPPILRRPLFPNLTRFQDLNQSMGYSIRKLVCANQLDCNWQILVYRRPTLSYCILAASSRYQWILDCHQRILSYRIFTISSPHRRIMDYH